MKCYLGALFLFGITTLYAQVSVNSSGGSATGANGSTSYTIGQVFYTTDAGNGSSAKGVQQPVLIEIVGLDPGKSDPGMVLFPNPATTSVHLTVAEEYLYTHPTYILLGVDLRTVKKGKIEATDTEIPFHDLSAGGYLLVIKNSNSESRSFKVIKIDR